MKIITRDEWGARPATGFIPTVPARERTQFVVHHSAGPATQTVLAIQRYHQGVRGWYDIGYNFLVRGTTGEIYEGRGWNKLGAHVEDHNTPAIGVCVIGRDILTPPAMVSLRQLYRLTCARFGRVLDVRGHRDFAPTNCPGDHTYQWLADGHLQQPTRTLMLTTPRMHGPDVDHVQQIVHVHRDSIFGPLTRDAVIDWQQAHGLKPDGIVGPLTHAAMGL